MTQTRRWVLGAVAGGLTVFTGCSALSDPEQSLMISVHNYTDSRHQGHLLIEHDGSEVVRQYLEVGPAPPDEWTTVETKVALGKMPNGTRLDVTASFGDGLKSTDSITLNCPPEYEGDGLFVQFVPESTTNPQLRDPCFSEFPSSEAHQGGTNRS